ncbi:MAG TPA: LPXTG cell wall anchor domain-containing protein [Dehalococcoidia bacterium]
MYVRLLVSTNPVVEAKSNAGLVAGIVVGIMLLGYGGYYHFRRKAKPE